MLPVQFPDTMYICVECRGEYSDMPWGGYCDDTLDCAMSGELFEVATGNIVTQWD